MEYVITAIVVAAAVVGILQWLGIRPFRRKKVEEVREEVTHIETEPLPVQVEREATREFPLEPITCALPGRVEAFKGREDECREIAAAVKGGQAAAIYGVPGIGKTALATEIGPGPGEEEALPQGTVFVKLGPHAALLPTLDYVAACLGDVAFKDYPAERKPFLFSRLLTEKRVLVVYDNLWSEDLGNELIRCRGISPVIITGRPRMGLEVGKVIELKELEPKEARALFKAHARIPEGEAQHDAAVDEICNILKKHPLAVKVAAKNCFTYKLSPERMLDRLREGNVIAVLDIREEGESLARSFSISYNLMGEEERALFRSLGVFGGATISEEAISAVYGGEEVEERLRRLMDVALLERDAASGRYILHHLLREYARLLLDENPAESIERRTLMVSFFLQGAESAFNKLNPEGHQEALAWYAVEMEHLREARRWALEIGEERTGIELAYNALKYMAAVGLWEEAVRWGEDGLQAAEELGDSGLISKACLSLGKTLQDKGDYNAALQKYETGLGEAKKAHGEGSNEAAGFLNNIGLVYHEQGRLDEALVYLEKAKEIWETIFGTDHFRTAISYNNIGRVLRAQGKFVEALDHHKEALAIRERVLGTDHPDTATSYNNIGSVLQDRGKLDEALDHYRRALAIRERVLGEDHPLTASSYNNIGAILHDQGKLSDALTCCKKALEIRESVLGNDHPDTATSYNNVGTVLQRQGKLNEALELLKRALAIREKVLGKDHPDTAQGYNNIGLVLHAQGKLDEALGNYTGALGIFEKVLGNDHPNTATSYNNIGLVLQAQGRLDEALEPYKRALAIFERVLGTDHLSTATSYNNIGSVLHAQGRLDEALEHYRRALAVRKKVLGEDHPRTATSYNNIGGVLRAQGELDEALDYCKRGLNIREMVLGKGHPDSATSYNNFGVVLRDKGELRDALGYFERAHAIRLKVYGLDHEDTKTARRHMDDVRKRLGEQ